MHVFNCIIINYELICVKTYVNDYMFLTHVFQDLPTVSMSRCKYMRLPQQRMSHPLARLQVDHHPWRASSTKGSFALRQEVKSRCRRSEIQGRDARGMWCRVFFVAGILWDELRNTKGVPPGDSLTKWYSDFANLTGVQLTLPELLENMSTAIDSSWRLDKLITQQMTRIPPLVSHHWQCWDCDWWICILPSSTK